jgi:hypothetical protein
MLFIVSSVYLVNLLTNGYISSLISLKPDYIFEKMQLWRLFSFPFAGGTLESDLLFFITFLFFAPKLEKLFHRVMFPILLFLLFCLQGTILTLVYWKSSLVFTGMEGISFFILTFFLFINIKNKFRFIKYKNLKTTTVIPIIFCIWFISVFLHSLFSGVHEVFIRGMSGMIFGVTSGFIAYLQIRLTRKLLSRKPILSDLTIPRPEELTPALISFKEERKLKQNLKNVNNDNIKPILTEDRLNEILDKLGIHGKESLTPDEIKFLEDYSKSI